MIRNTWKLAYFFLQKSIKIKIKTLVLLKNISFILKPKQTHPYMHLY